MMVLADGYKREEGRTACFSTTEAGIRVAEESRRHGDTYKRQHTHTHARTHRDTHTHTRARTHTHTHTRLLYTPDAADK